VIFHYVSGFISHFPPKSKPYGTAKASQCREKVKNGNFPLGTATWRPDQSPVPGFGEKY
jgi:hypothetical protein